MAAHHVHAMDGEPSRKAQHASERPAERSGLSFITAERIEAAKLLAAGGVAGAVSKSATAPLARLTILYQVDEWAGAANICCVLHQLKQLPCGCSMSQPQLSRHASVLLQLLPLQVRGLHLDHRPQQQSLRAAVRQIVQQEGVRALWKGNGVSWLSACKSAASLGGHPGTLRCDLHLASRHRLYDQLRTSQHVPIHLSGGDGVCEAACQCACHDQAKLHVVTVWRAQTALALMYLLLFCGICQMQEQPQAKTILPLACPSGHHRAPPALQRCELLGV